MNTVLNLIGIIALFAVLISFLLLLDAILSIRVVWFLRILSSLIRQVLGVWAGWSSLTPFPL